MIAAARSRGAWRRAATACAAVLGVVASVGSARADEPSPVARAALAAGAEPAELALIVGNNRGTTLGRADLHYADDDGAKFRALFRARAERPGDVRLLTRFDRDTARLFDGGPGGAGAADGAPSRTAVAAAIDALAARSVELRRAGRAVRFTFVYAGHGDVDRGKGFVELEDGAFGADDLAAAVRRVDATHTNVILDSCNSVFLVAPRRPGGRHVATGSDALAALRARLPRVGVFLSTSPDGEVFEWSELGAGIFSHAVRSGLTGAADANGDGVVTYAELRGFVEVATDDVKNPRYRPKVFARGPDGDDHAAVFAPGAAKGRRVVLEGPSRTTLRDGDEIPWVDAHVEAGARVELLVPPPLDDGRGTQEVLDAQARPPRVLARHALGDDASAREELASARGRSDLFADLFARPFGPQALAALPAPRDEVQGYGLSRDDATRFATLLDEVAATERGRRIAGGLGLLGAGLVAGGVGAVLLARGASAEAKDAGTGSLASAAGFLVSAPLVGFRKGPGERLRASYHYARETGAPPSQAVARAEEELFALARRERTYRTVGGLVLGGLVVAGGAAFVANELGDAPDPYQRGLLGSALSFTAIAGLLVLQPTPIERLADVWRAEPTRAGRGVAISPVGPGGSGLTLSGRF